MVASVIHDKKDDVLLFISQQLQENQPRDDYRELLELSSVFLGNRPTENFTFKTPGPTHHARWLSKAIYSLKIYLFQEQFSLSRAEAPGLRHICIFIVLLYIKAWYCAPSAIHAPRKDLEFMKNLLNYKKINKNISEVASKKFSTHLWYLSEQLICLSLFDDNVSAEIKLRLIESIQKKVKLKILNALM
ncbi:unnamed protein product [Psylliodes chrysocephalus]|uniref:Uncharacterized protein n=1 Tax=Psylliodes chrysocephalus TaxID=3402493 RepID=A0A9P0DED9_9CUCU|nr:unnamed protein product [Psylliodes chrysocephala]